MKNLRNSLLLTTLISAFALSTFAQDYNEEGSLYDAVNKNKYGDNWILSLGGSANLMLGEQDQEAPHFWDRMKEAWGGQLSVGKWFNPTFGMRLQVAGGTLSGYQWAMPTRVHLPHNYYVISNTNPQQHVNYPKGFDLAVQRQVCPIDGVADGWSLWENPELWKGFRTATATSAHGTRVVGWYQDFWYGNATIDLMMNLTTLLRGRYVPDNKFDFIPFVGIGMVYGFENDLFMNNYYSIDTKIGFRALYNLSDRWGIFFEPQANATTPEFDAYRGDVEADAFLNFVLGVQYTFHKRVVPFEKLVSDEIDNLNKKVNENRYLIDQHQDILERHQDLLDRLQKCCEEKPVVTQVVDNRRLPEYVRFLLDSYKIEIPEHRKIDDVVDYLKSKPEAKLLLVGYADRQTGNPRYNYNLSQKRVEAVANELKRLGIEESRISIEWRGDREQPFAQNEWNRVVILVER